MKTWIITPAIAALTLICATPRAEARSHRGHAPSSYIYISGYRSCGTPVYTERVLIGYDRYGDPIWRYREARAPKHYRPVPPLRCHPAPACPPPSRGYHGYRNGGMVIQGGFRL